MARAPRQDQPGAWHHVINRGLAKRPLFEDRIDYRYFLSRLAREVRRGRLEIHCWCLLATHFHLLVRSPTGELSEALRQSQNEYSRHFNRRHKRDGTLIRGRFFSKPVMTLAYRRILVRYIDRNPVKAGLSREPWLYRWGSAVHYVYRSGPKWLERGWIEGEIAATRTVPSLHSVDYRQVFGSALSSGAERLVESRDSGLHHGEDDLDCLLEFTSSQALDWMKRKATLADGCEIGLPVCDAPSVQGAIGKARDAVGPWNLRPPSSFQSGWGVIEVALLRTMARLTWQQIASAVGRPLSTCQRWFSIHSRMIEEDPTYAMRSADLSLTALHTCHSVGIPCRTLSTRSSGDTPEISSNAGESG